MATTALKESKKVEIKLQPAETTLPVKYDNADAAYAAARAHSLAKNHTQATEYYRQAAEMGHANAQCLYAHRLSKWEGTCSWLQKAAQQEEKVNDPEALFHLASSYDNGFHGTPNKEKSVKLYSIAAALGNLPAQYKLGRLDSKEYKVSDQYLSNAWLQAAVDNDNEEQKQNPSHQMSRSYQRAKQDCQELRAITLTSLDSHHTNEKEFRQSAAELHERATDDVLAIEQHQTLINLNDHHAPYILGKIHERQGNHVQALLWWQVGAARGDAAAQFELYSAYNTGQGTEKRFDLAVAFLMRAANGNSEACYQYSIYLASSGNHDQALAYLETIAAGDLRAACKAFELYYQQKNFPQARKHYQAIEQLLRNRTADTTVENCRKLYAKINEEEENLHQKRKLKAEQDNPRNRALRNDIEHTAGSDGKKRKEYYNAILTILERIIDAAKTIATGAVATEATSAMDHIPKVLDLLSRISPPLISEALDVGRYVAKHSIEKEKLSKERILADYLGQLQRDNLHDITVAERIALRLTKHFWGEIPKKGDVISRETAIAASIKGIYEVDTGVKAFAFEHIMELLSFMMQKRLRCSIETLCAQIGCPVDETPTQLLATSPTTTPIPKIETKDITPPEPVIVVTQTQLQEIIKQQMQMLFQQVAASTPPSPTAAAGASTPATPSTPPHNADNNLNPTTPSEELEPGAIATAASSSPAVEAHAEIPVTPNATANHSDIVATKEKTAPETATIHAPATSPQTVPTGEQNHTATMLKAFSNSSATESKTSAAPATPVSQQQTWAWKSTLAGIVSAIYYRGGPTLADAVAMQPHDPNALAASNPLPDSDDDEWEEMHPRSPTVQTPAPS